MNTKYKNFEDFYIIKEDIEDNLLGDEYAYVDLNPSNIDDQKFLANFYETSLGHIELIDNVKHIYNVTTEERTDIKVVLYSEENVMKIKNNSFNYFIKGLEDPLKELNYPIIDSIGKVDLYKYINIELLESNFKLKFKIEKFLIEKNEYKFIRKESEYYVFES